MPLKGETETNFGQRIFCKILSLSMLKKHALIEMFVIFPTTCNIMFSSAYELKPRLNSQILDYIFGLMKHMLVTI